MLFNAEQNGLAGLIYTQMLETHKVLPACLKQAANQFPPLILKIYPTLNTNG